MNVSRTIWTHGAALVLGAAGVIGLSVGLGMGRVVERGGAQPEFDPAKMQEAMDAWMKSIEPGKAHEFLKQFEGEWDTTMRMFMMPGAAPMESKGSATLSLIHGGRFLKQESTGEMMLPGADGAMKNIPTTGLGLTGYDNNRKLYTMLWTDSMGTGMFFAKGNLSQDGKTLTVIGEMDEPMTGEIGKPVKYVMKNLGADRHVFEIYEILYGDEFKVVEFEYNRKKAG